MGIAAYVKGAVLQWDNHLYTLDRELEREKWLILDMSTGFTRVMTLFEMQQKYAKGEMVFRDATDTHPVNRTSNVLGLPAIIQPQHPEAKLNKAKIRRLYILAVMSLPVTQGLMEPAIRQVWEKILQPAAPPHWITVARWKKKFIHGGNDVAALVTRNGKKGKWSRYPQEVILMVREAIETRYLARPPGTIQMTLDEAIVAIRKENSLRPAEAQLPEPTRRLVKRIIDGIPAFDRYVAHHGRIAAANKFRGTLHMHVTDTPLERVEMDHTQLDIFVLRDGDLVPLGRPYLTVCLDTGTRCVLGIYIGFEPPSFLTVARCLKHAILPKIDLQQIYPEIAHPWNPHGIPVTVGVDNAQEFHGESLENVCLSLNIQIVYSPRKTPWHKGKVERFLGTLNRAIAHGTPGTTFSNIFDKGDYDPAKHAVLTLSDLRLVVHKWIADVYHQRPHRGNAGTPPAAAWDSCISQQDIRIADDPRRLDVILGTTDQRLLTGKGISLNSLIYNSPELHGLFKRYGRDGQGFNVDLRIDEGDLGHIHVIVPGTSGHVLRVPALDQAYARGTSLWMHKVFKRYASNHSYANDPNGWRQANIEITTIVKRGLARKGQKGNARIARFWEAGKQKSSDQPGNPTIIPDPPPSSEAEVIEHPLTSLRVRPVYGAILEQRNLTPNYEEAKND